MKYVLVLFLIFLAGRSTAQRAGDLDSSFGTNGSVILNDLEGYAYGIATLPDGHFYVTGSYYIDYALFKFNPNGSPDHSFNGTGMDTFYLNHFPAGPECIAIQSNGSVITVGEGGNDTGGNTKTDAIAVRYMANGGLDTSFNSTGIAITDINHSDNQAHALALQPDGKIISAGEVHFAFALIRYNTDGSLDSSFGGSGIVVNPTIIEGSHGNAVVLQPDGKIIIAGYSGYSILSMTLLRYNSTGILDSTFGINGIVQTYISGYLDGIASLAVLSDGKILAGGYSWQDSVGYDFALVRYNPNGSVDSSFGINGIVVTDLGNGENDRAYAMAVQPDGKIVLAGRSYAATRRFALVRYLQDGSLDTSFGNDGKVVTAINSSNNSEIWGMALQADGGILVCGHVNDGNGINHFAVARYLGSSHVGIPQINDVPGITVSPNPCSGTFSIKGNIKGRKLQAVVTNMLGQVVASDEINIIADQVNSTMHTRLPDGVYIVSIYNETGLQYHSRMLIAR